MLPQLRCLAEWIQANLARVSAFACENFHYLAQVLAVLAEFVGLEVFGCSEEREILVIYLYKLLEPLWHRVILLLRNIVQKLDH